MASYLNYLAPGPGSMMVFVNQPVTHKAESPRLLCNARLLSLPLPLKIFWVAPSVVPTGTFLGCSTRSA